MAAIEQMPNGADTAALADRIHKLRIVLPAMAQEAAEARREVMRLRRENAALRRELSELRAQT